MARALIQSWFVDFDLVRAKLDGRPPPPSTQPPPPVRIFLEWRGFRSRHQWRLVPV